MADQANQDNANKGLNTKTYMAAVIVGILVLLAAFLIYVGARGPKTIPKVVKPNPNSRLVLPAPAGSLA